MLSKILGFESEIEMVGKKWEEFIPESTKDLTALIHRETIENKNGTVESTGEIVTGNCKILVVKWFHSFINSELEWVFSMGVPFNIDGQETIENVRTFYKEILARDKTTIEAIKKRIYREKI